MVRWIVNYPVVVRRFLDNASEEHHSFVLHWDVPIVDGGKILWMQKIEPSVPRPVDHMEITGPCEFKIGEFNLRRARLGRVSVGWETTDISDTNAMVVVTQDEAGKEMISVNFKGVPKPS